MAVKSVITNDMEHCIVCGSPYVEVHHVFYGTANRKQSDKYHYVVPLCPQHHRGSDGVHFNGDLDRWLKEKAQRHFESEIGTRDEFRLVFGKSWL